MNKTALSLLRMRNTLTDLGNYRLQWQSLSFGNYLFRLITTFLETVFLTFNTKLYYELFTPLSSHKIVTFIHYAYSLQLQTITRMSENVDV